MIDNMSFVMYGRAVFILFYEVFIVFVDEIKNSYFNIKGMNCHY